MYQTRDDILNKINYLQSQLDTAWNRIDFLNLYVYALQQQIKAMGGTPIQPESTKNK